MNPHFDNEELAEYSTSTRRNLARLDEDRIDFDLLEELVTYIDQEYGEGAILVFLPGELTFLCSNIHVPLHLYMDVVVAVLLEQTCTVAGWLLSADRRAHVMHNIISLCWDLWNIPKYQ